ncbi:hypothetical protein LguiB_007447 [Lonicera macranthoides]
MQVKGLGTLMCKNSFALLSVVRIMSRLLPPFPSSSQFYFSPVEVRYRMDKFGNINLIISPSSSFLL